MEDKEKVAITLDSDFAEKVRKRFAQKSIIRSARLLAQRLKITSWGINLFSFLLALYAVYYFAAIYSLWKAVGLFVIGVGLLAAWELAKRYCIINFFEGVYDERARQNILLGIPIVVLLGGSIATTYFGGEKLVIEESSSPEVVHNSQIDSLALLIAEAKADNELMKKQTWDGRIVRDARKQMNILQSRIDILIAEKIKLENRDLDSNDEIQESHKQRLTNFGVIFGGMGALADIALIILLGIAERKEWEVFCLIRSQSTQPVTNKRSPERLRTAKERVTDASKAPKIAAEKRSIGFIKNDNNRSCLSCGTDISNRRSDAKYCSPTCRKTHWQAKASA